MFASHVTMISWFIQFFFWQENHKYLMHFYQIKTEFKLLNSFTNLYQILNNSTGAGIPYLCILWAGLTYKHWLSPWVSPCMIHKHWLSPWVSPCMILSLKLPSLFPPKKNPKSLKCIFCILIGHSTSPSPCSIIFHRNNFVKGHTGPHRATQGHTKVHFLHINK